MAALEPAIGGGTRICDRRSPRAARLLDHRQADTAGGARGNRRKLDTADPAFLQWDTRTTTPADNLQQRSIRTPD